MAIAEGAQRRDVGRLQLRVVRQLGQDAGDVARGEEPLHRGEVAHVGDEVVRGVGGLLEQAGRIDVEPAELDPGAASAGTLHGVDRGDRGGDGVHARRGEQDVGRCDAGEVGRERGLHRRGRRADVATLRREVSVGLARGDEDARMLDELREARRGVARRRRQQHPIADVVERRHHCPGAVGPGQRRGARDEREKFAGAAQRGGRARGGRADEPVADEAGVADGDVAERRRILALVAFDVGERGQADDGRVRRGGHGGAQGWGDQRHGQRPATGSSFWRICSRDWRRRMSATLPSRRSRTSGASGKEL